MPDSHTSHIKLPGLNHLPGSRRLQLSAILLTGLLAFGSNPSLNAQVATKTPAPAAPEALVEAKPAAGPADIQGRILSSVGKPLPGATVDWIVPSPGGGSELVEATKTADDGTFNLDPLKRSELKPNPAPGILDRMLKGEERPREGLVIRANGAGLTFAPIPAGGEVGDLRMNAATELDVPFLRPDGKPAAREQVRLLIVFEVQPAMQFFLPPWNSLADYTATTDEAGIARFPGLPPGYQTAVDIEDDQYARLGLNESMMPLAAAPITHDKTVHLSEPSTISGIVTFGDTKKPVADIAVMATDTRGSGAWDQAITGPDGRYRLNRLRPGIYMVAVTLSEDLQKVWVVDSHPPVKVTANAPTTGVDLQLSHGGTLTVRVVAADTGKPVPGVRLFVQRPGGAPGQIMSQMLTGPDGACVQQVSPGAVVIQIIQPVPPGYFDAGVTGRAVVPKGGAAQVTLTLKTAPIELPRPVLHGVVLQPDGKPAPGVTVTLLPEGTESYYSETSATNGQGLFSFPPDQQRTFPRARLRAVQGGALGSITIPVTETREQTIQLVAGQAGTLSGTVRNADAAPLVGPTVSATEWSGNNGRGGQPVQVDPDGSFKITGLWPGAAYSLTAHSDGHGVKQTDQITLKPGEERTVPPLIVLKADQSVSGMVVNEKGEPAPNINVYAYGPNTGSSNATTAADGTFRLDNLVNEPVTVFASANDGTWAEIQGQAGQKDIVLTLTKTHNGYVRPQHGRYERLSMLVGKPAPPLPSKGWVNGAAPNLLRLHGRTVILAFWGSGTDSPADALKALQSAAQHPPRPARAAAARPGVRPPVVLGVVDSAARPAEILHLLHENKLLFPALIDADDPVYFGQAFRHYGLMRVPAFAVIDASGKLTYLGHSVRDALQKAAATNHPDAPPTGTSKTATAATTTEKQR